MTTASASSATASSARTDALVIGVAQGPRGLVLAAGSESVAKAFGKGLLPALTGLGATGKAEQVTTLASLGATKAAVVVAVGLGEVAPVYDAELLRRATGAAIRALEGTAAVALALPTEDAVSLRAVTEGALLGAYAFHGYRTTSLKDHKPPVAALTVLTSLKDAKDVVRRATVVAGAVALARDLVNTPPSDLHPIELAGVAEEQAKKVGLTVEVLDEKALKKGAFGGILGVGQGSANPPRLVHLSYKGGRGAKTTVALIGKGITFDSGGISIKPAAGMEDMKSDMGGAAAVIAAMTAIAQLKPAIDVEAWVPMAENMPSGTAIRPSDVLTMRGGKKIEVNNTDAEGRLILGDAIARACEDEPDYVLDVATLTGAQVVALGARTSGVMANDDDLRAHVVSAATTAGESMWGMPLPADLRKGLDSEIADMVNTGPREGGMLTAGLFLQEFVAEGVKWSHWDIAGPAYNGSAPFGYTPAGGTGAAVRTFVQLLEELSA